MKLENMNQEFPKMPDSMRKMVEQEVEQQLQKKTRKFTGRRVMIAVLAATLALGTTAFAGVLYRMKNQQVGTYAVKTTQEKEAGAEKDQVQSTGETHYVRLNAEWLPDGMVQTEEGKYSYENTYAQGGVSMLCYYMDTGDSAFEMLTQQVVESETLDINGREGIYLGQQVLGDDLQFNQQLYVAYPDLHLVLEMTAASDVSKEDAIRIAEHVTLTPVEQSEDKDVMLCYNWSSYLNADGGQEMADESDLPVTSVTMESLKAAHAVGDAFDISENDLEKQPGLTAKVTDVQIGYNRSMLSDSMLGEDDKQAFASDGTLLPVILTYVKEGDGVNTLDQVIRTEEEPQKLVCVTVEYTNNGTDTLKDVMFNGTINILEPDGDMAKIWRADTQTPSENDEWTYVAVASHSFNTEVGLFDVKGGERSNNYIDSLAPGETVTVHWAFAVPEEKLGEMYFDLGNTCNLASDLPDGYVTDIRQQAN